MSFSRCPVLFSAFLLLICFAPVAFAQEGGMAFPAYRDQLKQHRIWLDTTLNIEPVKKGSYWSPAVEHVGNLFRRVFDHYYVVQHWAGSCAPTYELNWIDSLGKGTHVPAVGHAAPLLFDELNSMLMRSSGKLHLVFYEDGYLLMELHEGSSHQNRYYTLNRFGHGSGPMFSSYISMLSQRFVPGMYDTLTRQIMALEQKIYQFRGARVDSLATYRLLYATYEHQGWSAYANPRQSHCCFVVDGIVGDTLKGYELQSIEGAGYLRMLLDSGALTRAIPTRNDDSIARSIQALKETKEDWHSFSPFGRPAAYGDRYVVITRTYSEHDAMDDIDDKAVYYLEKVKR